MCGVGGLGAACVWRCVGVEGAGGPPQPPPSLTHEHSHEHSHAHTHPPPTRPPPLQTRTTPTHRPTFSARCGGSTFSAPPWARASCCTRWGARSSATPSARCWGVRRCSPSPPRLRRRCRVSVHGEGVSVCGGVGGGEGGCLVACARSVWQRSRCPSPSTPSHPPTPTHPHAVILTAKEQEAYMKAHERSAAIFQQYRALGPGEGGAGRQGGAGGGGGRQGVGGVWVGGRKTRGSCLWGVGWVGGEGSGERSPATLCTQRARPGARPLPHHHHTHARAHTHARHPPTHPPPAASVSRCLLQIMALLLPMRRICSGGWVGGWVQGWRGCARGGGGGGGGARIVGRPRCDPRWLAAETPGWQPQPPTLAFAPHPTHLPPPPHPQAACCARVT